VVSRKHTLYQNHVYAIFTLIFEPSNKK